MDKGFEAVGELLLPRKGLDLSGSMYVQCGFQVFDGGRIERDDKLGLINVGGKKVGEHVCAAKSFMRNWARHIRQLFYVPSGIADQYSDDGGIARANALQSDNPSGGGDGVTAAAADFAFGSSNGAVLSTQTNLITPVLGPTPGVTVTVLQEDSLGRVFKVEASLLNGGGLVNILEVGLFAHLRQQNVGGQNHRTMFMRDILGVAVPVANGQTALGRYTFTALI